MSLQSGCLWDVLLCLWKTDRKLLMCLVVFFVFILFWVFRSFWICGADVFFISFGNPQFCLFYLHSFRDSRYASIRAYYVSCVHTFLSLLHPLFSVVHCAYFLLLYLLDLQICLLCVSSAVEYLFISSQFQMLCISILEFPFNSFFIDANILVISFLCFPSFALFLQHVNHVFLKVYQLMAVFKLR